MNYNPNSLVPFIPPEEYDAVAEEFLSLYCEEALLKPMAVPIEHIAKNGCEVYLSIRGTGYFRYDTLYGWCS